MYSGNECGIHLCIRGSCDVIERVMDISSKQKTTTSVSMKGFLSKRKVACNIPQE